MIKFLFVDIDGTLTETISGETFKQNPQDVKVIEGADKAVTHYHNNGWTIIGVSNQGGCSSINPKTGKYYKELTDAIAEMQFTMQLIPELLSVYFCPDFEGRECWKILQLSASNVSQELPQFVGTYRKPDPGMILHNLESCLVEVGEAWMVGDRPEDEQCATNAGINFCPANVWRDRFRPGVFEHQITPGQLKFLEGIDYGRLEQ
ncbi:HAD hydrolase-like protein [Nostoc sp. CENA67]|uniref:HAD hydrolase-like protein n=1 Tax=Amazonocrinis nigriterrae CENA67 TaxID=2794033 RepID=A0A8J7LCG0_9NOST|nr:HAD hydrolase-like protein [Amazonocrinis nigriterrae]MBH8566755.1 HAD hydrolase-like protein [Amazonocrinis nigriterrae CENA67]